MTSTEPVWMTREAYTRLKAELAALRSRPNIEVPEDFMDYDDNLVANYTARQARIRQIQDLLTNAVVGEDPPDDGIAEPGMVLTVRYDDTGEIETFLLGVRGVEDADIDVYSMQSPLGQRDRRGSPGRAAHLLHPQWGQPARHAPQGGALRNARAEIPAATVCATATHQRSSATCGDANRQRADTQAHSDGLASRPLRYLDRRAAMDNDVYRARRRMPDARSGAANAAPKD